MEATLLEGEPFEVIVTSQRFLFAPVEKGRVIGKAVVRTGGGVAAEFNLTAAAPVSLPAKAQTWWEKWFDRKK